MDLSPSLQVKFGNTCRRNGPDLSISAWMYSASNMALQAMRQLSSNRHVAKDAGLLEQCFLPVSDHSSLFPDRFSLFLVELRKRWNYREGFIVDLRSSIHSVAYCFHPHSGAIFGVVCLPHQRHEDDGSGKVEGHHDRKEKGGSWGFIWMGLAVLINLYVPAVGWLFRGLGNWKSLDWLLKPSIPNRWLRGRNKKMKGMERHFVVSPSRPPTAH